MAGDEAVLHFGLRRSRLEWAAELAAAEELGYTSVVAAPGGLGYTGLPDRQTLEIANAAPGRELAEAAVCGLTEGPFSPAAVVCWSDRYVQTAAQAAAALGLRGPQHGARVCVDKAAQRTALEPLGLNPPWRSGAGESDLRAAVDELGSSLVFKPAHASGGRGVAALGAESDAAAAMAGTARNYTSSTAFVVERYVAGTEHSVAGIAVDGEPVVHAIADKAVDEDGAGFCARTTVVPSALPGEAAARLREAAEEAVRAVGIHTSGFHVDLRMSEGRPVVLEVGARLGGDLINSHLVPLATGHRVVPYARLVRALATGEPASEPAATTAAAALLVIALDGSDGAEVVERARKHPAAELAADWPTDGAPAIAVAVCAFSPRDLPAVEADLRTWLEGVSG